MLSKTFYILSSKMFKIFHNGPALLISLAILPVIKRNIMLTFIQVIVNMSKFVIEYLIAMLSKTLYVLSSKCSNYSVIVLPY
jgi:hypothetical protein